MGHFIRADWVLLCDIFGSPVVNLWTSLDTRHLCSSISHSICTFGFVSCLWAVALYTVASRRAMNGRFGIGNVRPRRSKQKRW